MHACSHCQRTPIVLFPGASKRQGMSASNRMAQVVSLCLFWQYSLGCPMGAPVQGRARCLLNSASSARPSRTARLFVVRGMVSLLGVNST